MRNKKRKTTRYRNQEIEYDEAMALAARIFEDRESVSDPYSMHKAVESISSKILKQIVNRRKHEKATAK